MCPAGLAAPRERLVQSEMISTLLGPPVTATRADSVLMTTRYICIVLIYAYIELLPPLTPFMLSQVS